MRNKSGITLVVLVVTIVVLLILLGIGITSGKGLMEYSKIKIFLSELKVVQSQVNIASEKIKLGNIELLTYGRELTIEEKEKYINGPLQNVGDSLNNYKYFTPTELAKINAREIKQDILINFETRDVVSVNGIEINNEIHYRQSDFDEETYNVGYEERKVKVGDYINYVPDIANNYNVLSTYSGYPTDQTILQEKLNWRVLDIKDGKIRLISETPTNGTLGLSGYNGYNNAVYYINDICNKQYSKANYSTAKGLSIEDIQEKMNLTVWDYRESEVNNYKYGSTLLITGNYRNYPSIWKKENTSIINGINTNGTVSLSEQDSLITGYETATTSITGTQTYWGKALNNDNFIDKMYYTLFIKDLNKYWLSSRCNGIYPASIPYMIRYIGNTYVGGYDLYESSGTIDGHIISGVVSESKYKYAIRPVVTLNSDVKVDLSTGNGTTAETAWNLK